MMGGQWSSTAKDVTSLGDASEKAAGNARALGESIREAGGSTDGFRTQLHRSAQEADSLGAAFRGAMKEGRNAGQSAAKSFGTGLTGALDFSRGKFNAFASTLVTKTKGIAAAWKNPVQRIGINLVKAMHRARESSDAVGDGAEDAQKDLEEMGDAGESAGDQIKGAISGALQAFVGLEAIKQGVELLKQFGAAAIEAFGAAENTAAKFERTFSSEASDWVENYSDAVHRSTAEVQGFMVQNQALFRGLGITADAAEDLSEITTSLAYDFGNAFRMDDAEALSALQSAIQGDAAALAEFGIVLDDNALKQSALQLGIGGSIDALDDAALAQVRLNAVLAQSGDIQQSAIRDTGGLINGIKSLKGIVGEFLSDAGERFAPVVERAVGAVMDEWPALEPMLLSFVDTLGGGLGDLIPVLSDLTVDLIPAASQTLGALMDTAGPLLGIFGDLAGAVLPPLANIVSRLAKEALPPLQAAFNALNTGVLQPLMPVLDVLSEQLLPVLGLALGSVAEMIGPMADAFTPLLTMILPSLGGLIQELAAAVIPPLTQALGVVTRALTPFVSIAGELVQSVLPIAQPLITGLSTVLSNVLLPVIEALTPAVSFVAELLGTVAGWISDLVGLFANGLEKVTGWFSGLFGGAKDSTDAVQALTGAVNELDGAASAEVSMAIDTSKYSKDVDSASEQAEKRVSEAMTAAREISDANYGQIARDAETAYASMTLDAESAWERMTAAAQSGTDKIVGLLDRIVSSARSLGSISVGIVGTVEQKADIPHHAEGTPRFEGGWTHMNEEGGELAFLPSGTAIIPADKTDEIIRSSTSGSTVVYEDRSSVSLTLHVHIDGGNGAEEDGLPDRIAQRVRQEVESLLQEKKEQEFHIRAMQGGYAIP